MISSGIKRGLAASAVSALAIAGVPLLASSASADSITSTIAGAGDTVLYTQYTGDASIANDGVDTTVHLLAGGGANIQQVRFEYDNGGTWTPIATVSKSNGAFSTEWTVPAALYNTDVDIQAVGLLSTGNPSAGTADGATVHINVASPSVNVGNAAGSAIGVFVQPYAGETATDSLGVVSGTANAGAAGVEVSNLTTGTATGTDTATLGTPANGTRTFTGSVDFTGYSWSAATPAVNEAVVGAASTDANGSDDAEAVSLYKQTITSVTATASPATVQGAGTSTATVTVLDQNGKPVSGAQVVPASGIADAEYTDESGQAKFTGLTGSAEGSQYAYYVNTTDSDGYDAAVDFRRTVTVTSYSPTATTITSSSHDGAAFDRDEYTAGDISVTVKDQSGAALAGQNLSGSWTFTPFGGTAAAPTTVVPADNGDGTYTVALPGGTSAAEGTYTLNVWIEKDGNPGQGSGDLSASALTVKTGEANLVWNDGGVAQAAAGSTATVKGVIELDDHTALPNRNVALTWTKNVLGDAAIAPQAAQPAGTTRVSDTAATAVSGSDGSFGLAIVDPTATPQTAELGGTVLANDANTPAYGTNNDNASSPLEVDFLADTVVSSSESDTDSYDLAGDATPGRPVHVDITVENAAGTPLTDLPVKVSTDHGFFTTPDATQLSELKADPAAADGAQYGEWEDLGSTYDTTTDDSGYAEAVVAIEKDSGFDDDGEVDATVTFTVGGKTFTEPVTFYSEDPFNGGEVTVTLDDTQTVSDATLPKAPTTEQLAWNVQATDQYGNLTSAFIDLDDAGSAADLSTSGTWSNFTDDSPNLYTSSDEAADQTVTGTWDNAPVTTWLDADTTTAGFQGDTDASDSIDTTHPVDITGDSETISWYDIDYSASTFTLTHTGSDTQPVGTTVTETYTAVDQNGEPIQGLHVDFFRTGPDDLQNGEGNGSGTTNAAGQAFYIFQGAKAGTATVTAVLSDGSTIIPQGEQTDVVKFQGTVDPKLKVSGSGGKTDKVKANAVSAAAGAKATLWVKGKKVASKTLNASGDTTFKVKDKNGKKLTKYTVKITAVSGKTTADKASKKIK
ncbi:beta strand repeat-containing protein [Nocardioides mangrovi]|uniref:Big-1 domain-containing protein n=1 Tax=Nocardioides mangrovi TaxID=2874580 RepID=A0ABS7UH01_9ACTN|nr:hypothetical protein [Nocardioides mangrovi]MBZ5740075.1 hypothetical protein [Nocardioides mangrovi]